MANTPGAHRNSKARSRASLLQICEQRAIPDNEYPYGFFQLAGGLDPSAY